MVYREHRVKAVLAVYPVIVELPDCQEQVEHQVLAVFQVYPELAANQVFQD